MTTISTTIRTLSLTVGIALTGLALAGCTGAGAPTADATTSTTTPAGTEEQQRTGWEADLRSCLAEAGFDVPAEGQADFGSRQGEYDLASQQCSDEVGPPPGGAIAISAEQRAAEAEATAAANACFADAGFSEGVGDDPDMMVEPEGVPPEVAEKCWAAADEAQERALDR
jgi:hypothetical protein